MAIEPPSAASTTKTDYRENAVGFWDVRRAADSLLRRGRKPSVAGIRQELGGGSPNTLTPLLAKYWQRLGERLAAGPAELERVPDALARVAELLWRRAVEEARETLRLLDGPGKKISGQEELQDQISKLSVALAEAKAREGEHLHQLARFSRERTEMQAERKKLLAILQARRSLECRDVEEVERVTVAKRRTPRAEAAKRRALPRRNSQVKTTPGKRKKPR